LTRFCCTPTSLDGSGVAGVISSRIHWGQALKECSLPVVS
jgi:hypothetical protein